MRRLLSFLNLFFSTLFLAFVALAASLFDPKRERVQKVARLWSWLILKVAGITVSLEGQENLASPPYLIMANHQSALDIFALLAVMPVSFKFIAKRELFRIPVFGWALRRADYISIDRENPREALKAIEEAVRKIRNGAVVLIFPEGTRSENGNLLPFMKGGFTLAARAQVPVVPLAIIGTNNLHPTGNVLSVPKRKGHVTLRAGKPMVTEGKGAAAKTEFMEAIREAIERLMSCPKN
jgi:1-acyl-sn-glycerol-3-phosphate acyltransferase